MEILNILYNNNHIAFYLIGAILVVIIIFIVISSMTTTPNDSKKEEILKDPTEKEEIDDLVINEEIKIDAPKINSIVEDLYQKKIIEEENKVEDNQDLNSFLEEFEVPNNVIEEVVNNETEIQEQEIEQTKQEENTPKKTSEDIENMLKRLYDLRQNENNIRKTALLNEIYDLKKQVDEALKSNDYNYSLNYNEIDTKALADYYLFNEDIEFPKLK